MKKIYFDNSIWNILRNEKDSFCFNELINLVNKKEIQIYVYNKEQNNNAFIKTLKDPSEILNLLFLNIIYHKKRCTIKQYETDEIFLSNEKELNNAFNYYEFKGCKIFLFCLQILNILFSTKELHEKNNIPYKICFFREEFENILNKEKFSIEEDIEKLLKNNYKELLLNNKITGRVRDFLMENIKFFFVSYLLKKDELKLHVYESENNGICDLTSQIKNYIDKIENSIEFYEKEIYFEFISNAIINILTEIIGNNNLINFNLFYIDQLIYSKYVGIFFYKDIDIYNFLPKENKEIYNKFKNVQNGNEIIKILREVINETKSSINC